MLTLHSVGAHGETNSKLSNVEMAISGGLAGVVAWMSTFGADVIKTRVQAVDRDLHDRTGQNAFFQAARATYRQGGWRAFFAGAGPTILRALPVNAALVRMCFQILPTKYSCCSSLGSSSPLRRQKTSLFAWACKDHCYPQSEGL
jgi:hypothetical protein